MILMVIADHGPAVSGAHNTTVTARAGKDLVSALCSGLLTIGPRFGGALDDAAKMFSEAHDSGVSPNAQHGSSASWIGRPPAVTLPTTLGAMDDTM